MLLREFINFKKSIDDLNSKSENLDKVYSYDFSDTRKTPKLTFKLINMLRKQSEKRQIEIEEELILIRKMYTVPTQESV